MQFKCGRREIKEKKKAKTSLEEEGDREDWVTSPWIKFRDFCRIGIKIEECQK